MRALFVFSVSLLLALQSVAQIDIYFATASHSIDGVQRKRIDSFVHSVKLQADDKISVTGYADHRKGRDSNDTLSLRRAQAVVDRLVKAGVAKELIVLCEGKGEVARDSMATTAELQRDRRVAVMVAKPGSAGSPQVVRRTRADSFFTNPTNIKVDATYTLDIFFEHGSLEVMKRCMPELRSLLKFMVDNTNVKIRIEGHVCCPGDLSIPSVNLRQSGSEGRAKYVYTYLIKNGIDSTRLSYAGYGATRPVVSPEVTQQDMLQNRRVDVRIVRR